MDAQPATTEERAKKVVQQRKQERRYDASKTNKPMVEIIPFPYRKDPLLKIKFFTVEGVVYEVYQSKKRGRHMIRLVGAVKPEEKVS